MSLQLITQPAYEPVSLAQAREWVRLESDDTANDSVLRLLIKAMREHAENLTMRAFIPRTYRLNIEGWPSDPNYGYKIDLPFAPLISVSSVQYIDLDGVTQTLDTSKYVVHAESEPGCIVPAWLQTWPAVRVVPNAIQVNFSAGYSPGSPDDEAGYQSVLPETLKLWMETKLATLFSLREQIIVGTIVAKLPRDFTDGLLDPLTLGERLF